MFYLFAVVVLMFGFVLLHGAPYLPTRRKQADAVFELLELSPGQLFLELGCGDGRVVRMAAEKGLVAVGYELNPILVLYARARTFRYRRNVRIIWGNFWRADLTEADGIYVFLLDKFMARLDEKIKKDAHKPVRLASFAFKLPEKKPDLEKDGVYLYKYRPKKT